VFSELIPNTTRFLVGLPPRCESQTLERGKPVNYVLYVLPSKMLQKNSNPANMDQWMVFQIEPGGFKDLLFSISYFSDNP